MNDGVGCGQVEVVHSPGHIASDGSDLLSGQSCGLHQASETSGQELCENDGLVIHSGSDELEKVWMASVRCDIHLPREEAYVVCGDDLVVKTLGSHSLASEQGHPDIGPPSFPQLLCSQVDLLPQHHPEWLALWDLANRPLEHLLKHCIGI